MHMHLHIELKQYLCINNNNTHTSCTTICILKYRSLLILAQHRLVLVYTNL